MTQRLSIHATHPQPRLLQQVVEVIQQGGVIAYPTDSAYALGCQLGQKEAIERIKRLRELDKDHNFTLICQNLSELGTYARVDNAVFRLLKANTPGAYTFILPASPEVPKRLQHPKRKTIGVRVPQHLITLELLKLLGEPLMSVTLMIPGQQLPLTDPEDIYTQLKGKVDLIVEGGELASVELTTVIDLTTGTPILVRKGKGDTMPFE